MIIIGAGLAGLIAATQFKNATVYEAGPDHSIRHKALLRFRTPDVGNATDIDFKKVTVHKGIWYNGKFHKPSIQLANWYSWKVTGKLIDRSIWNIDTCERYIAPNDLIEQLIDKSNGRIFWNRPITADDINEMQLNGDAVISTMPMSILTKLIGITDTPTFNYARINVNRAIIPNADVYQTIYFPDPAMHVYRASMTGELLIIESTPGAPESQHNSELCMIRRAFGIDVPIEIDFQYTTHHQRYGKIMPINDTWRRRFIFETTINRNIWSLGRFATWRNILLDDVLNDIHVIKRLINSDSYSNLKHL